MFEQLQDKFSKIFKVIKGHGKISENNILDAIREIRIALLESDVNYKVVKAFIERVKVSAAGTKVFDSVTPGQQFVKIVLDELTSFLTSNENDINLKSSTSVIVMSGLQGSGKTTTAVKLASFLKKENKRKPLIIGLDLQRPAAMDQLKVLAENNNLDYYIEKNTKDPINVLKNGISKSKEQKNDLIILDTAGRLHVDKKLISELNDIIKYSNPDEILFIADGMMGQDAVKSSLVFNESCNLTGSIITKLDGDSGGGVALSLKHVTKVPIKYITYGEKIHDIEKFNPKSIAKRILGLDDIIGLVEKAQKSFDQEELQKVQKKLLKNKFDLNDFKEQLNQFDKMGDFNQLIKFLPKIKNIPNINKMDDKKVKWIRAIIDSMTIKERSNPEIINGSRKKRISKGCGRSVNEINQLLKQFNNMKIMMKKMNNKGFNKFPF